MDKATLVTRLVCWCSKHAQVSTDPQSSDGNETAVLPTGNLKNVFYGGFPGEVDTTPRVCKGSAVQLRFPAARHSDRRHKRMRVGCATRRSRDGTWAHATGDGPRHTVQRNPIKH